MLGDVDWMYDVFDVCYCVVMVVVIYDVGVECDVIVVIGIIVFVYVVVGYIGFWYLYVDFYCI